ncbi:helix-turn-helix transcriptional regulator [Virgibacillus kekensis]|uniref:Helix-turn-helix transcriptional regulator n=1 Tax=Virgibacillus kekensis TaxID=202261 RepID=A0ABV9DKG4_9BACI
MEQTLKVTNVLSDPTRYSIYQYMITQHKEVNVTDIARSFKIHPNVARLHLTKLEDINLIESYALKTGKGGRPSRMYRLSNEVIELNFPHRDYKLLSTIAMESFVELGEAGRNALYKTGKKYGSGVVERSHGLNRSLDMSTEQKLNLIEDAGMMLGMYPTFNYSPESNSVSFIIRNCPFKEVAVNNHKMVCELHNSFIKGMFEALFTGVVLEETENMFNGCENCSYMAKFSIV